MRTLASARLQHPQPAKGPKPCVTGGTPGRGFRGMVSAGEFHLLLVTEVTRMTGGYYCVAAQDVYEERIVRPLAPDGGYWSFLDEASRWRPGCLLEVSARREVKGELPHRRENLVLCRYPRVLDQWEEPELYGAVIVSAPPSVRAQFGVPLVENRYVVEGTDCPSLGCVRTRRDRVSFQEDRPGRLRFRLMDGDDQVYTLPVTCETLQHLFSPKAGTFGLAAGNRWLQANKPDADLILRLGFARGYAGADGSYSPFRCYLQLNGILCPTDNYHLLADRVVPGRPGRTV